MSDKSVSRRKFLRGGAVAAGATAGAVAAPAVLAQAPKTLKMQGSWGASSIFSEMARQYTDRVEEMSGGKLKIDYLPAGAVVKAFQVQDACADGVLDCAHTVTAYWYGRNKAASLFGTGPQFGQSAAQNVAWMHFGGGNELYRELVQDILGLNLVGFISLPMPPQPLGWFNKEITSVDDIQGLKYRTVGLATDIMQTMGMKVTQLPGGEIVPALERGVIEAFEFNNPTADRQFGAQDVSKHYMLSSYHQAGEYFELIFNKDVYDDLDPAEQAIIKYAAEAANTANFGLAMDRYSQDLQTLINDDGVNVYRTPDSVLKAQLEAWDVVLKDLMEDSFFKTVVESQKAWAERVAYYTIQNEVDFRLAYNHYFPGKLPG